MANDSIQWILEAGSKLGMDNQEHLLAHLCALHEECPVCMWSEVLVTMGTVI